ncbi:MAG: 3-methyl-2-oxobutanoate hydroxymethyltransferase, partial [Candidatus Limnocylindria bacterium]
AVPTIGIGAGPYCDGQVLVHLVGLTPDGFRFVKRYAALTDTILQAVGSLCPGCPGGCFPGGRALVLHARGRDGRISRDGFWSRKKAEAGV